MDDLGNKLITNANLKRTQEELLSSYQEKTKNTRKTIEDLERRRYLKSEQDKLTKSFRLLRMQKLAKRSEKGALSYDDLLKTRKLLKLSSKDWVKIGQLRDINTTNVKKQDLIYTLLRTEPNVKESNYLKHINKNITTDTDEKANEIRKLLIETGKIFTNKEIRKYSKDINDINKIMSFPHKERVNYFQNLSMSTKPLFENVIRTKKI